ncbi:MAG: hypothetical protein Crog4KO_06580 [Crocinitomicaceae bacterium]
MNAIYFNIRINIIDKKNKYAEKKLKLNLEITESNINQYKQLTNCYLVSFLIS